MNIYSFIVAPLLVTVPTQASAHLVSTRFGAVYSGVLHPLTTLLHLTPWLALGLLVGLQKPSVARWALIAFPVAVLLGIGLAEWIPGVSYMESLNILSFATLGLLVALKLQLRKEVLLLLVGVFGLSHGYGNSTVEYKGAQWLLYSAGVGVTAYVLITLIAGLTNALASYREWGTIAVRAAGSWIAAVGVIYAGFVFTTLQTGS